MHHVPSPQYYGAIPVGHNKTEAAKRTLETMTRKKIFSQSLTTANNRPGVEPGAYTDSFWAEVSCWVEFLFKKSRRLTFYGAAFATFANGFFPNQKKENASKWVAVDAPCAISHIRGIEIGVVVLR